MPMVRQQTLLAELLLCAVAYQLEPTVQAVSIVTGTNSVRVVEHVLSTAPQLSIKQARSAVEAYPCIGGLVRPVATTVRAASTSALIATMNIERFVIEVSVPELL
jgi:hypothetical protein